MEEKNLSMRQVEIESALDHQVIRRLKEVHAKRSNMTYCILLADYFGVSPNEFLQLAGWPPLKVFDIKRASIDTCHQSRRRRSGYCKDPGPTYKKTGVGSCKGLAKEVFQLNKYSGKITEHLIMSTGDSQNEQLDEKPNKSTARISSGCSSVDD
jgi:hypothetical protein